jgi:DNA (cytosine-5)-methyltransferase 1
LNELATFAGAGGGILGGHLLGWKTVCAVEIDPYAACVLAARQNEGLLPPFPIWSDIRTFDGRPWCGRVDVISGGFPCQDISQAGAGAGINGERSGLWKELVRIIGEVRPRYVFVENSPMLTSRGLGTVLGDLATLGFHAEWGVLSASDVGAPHLRERIWILAYTDMFGRIHGEPQEFAAKTGEHAFGDFATGCGKTRDVADAISIRGIGGRQCDIRNEVSDARKAAEREPQNICPKGRGESLANSNREREQRILSSNTHEEKWPEPCEGPFGPLNNGFGQWAIEPNVGRVAHGVAARVDRIKAIGNGQVPLTAATPWRQLAQRAGIA